MNSPPPPESDSSKLPIFARRRSRIPVKSWPRLFQNLRASRETELASEYPLHVATAWIGNTARIAERHYLQIPDAHYKQAVRTDKAAQNTAHLAQKAAQYRAAGSRKQSHATPQRSAEKAFLPLCAGECGSLREPGLEMEGIEPSFPRCDRGVLPLHHIP